MSKFTCTLADLAFTLYARYPATERFCRDYLASGDGIAIAYSASEMAAEFAPLGDNFPKLPEAVPSLVNGVHFSLDMGSLEKQLLCQDAP